MEYEQRVLQEPARLPALVWHGDGAAVLGAVRQEGVRPERTGKGHPRRFGFLPNGELGRLSRSFDALDIVA